MIKAKATSEGRWRKDIGAGLVNGVVSVPDGLASAALAGVNPVAGLYTSVAGPIAGSALASAQRMQISTTSASALAAGEALSRYPPGERLEPLLIITVATGLFLALFWICRAGRLAKYVSQAVMIGFLTGVAVVLILDQAAPLLGYAPPPGSEPFQFWSLLTHLSEASWRTALIGLLALILAAVLSRTRIGNWASLIAMVVPTLLVILLGWEGIEQVRDVGDVGGGMPLPRLPDLGQVDLGLLTTALAIAAIVAIQGAGVSQSVTNLDGTPVSTNRDLLAQGAANVASGMFSGIPAGGSVGQTALNVSVGGQTRWSGIFGGLWMLAFLLFLAAPVGYVPMAVLAALMIVAGWSAIDLAESRVIWAVGWPARTAALVTFLASLFLSVTTAILLGMLLSVAISLIRAANDVTLKWLRPDADGHLVEDVLPPRLDPAHPLVVVNIYGSLFFAGARTLYDRLPRPDGAEQPAVILRMRGQTQVGATLVDVLDDYADMLANAGGRLYLTGLTPEMRRRLTAVNKLQDGNDPLLFEASERIGQSTAEAVQHASCWRRKSDT